MRKILFYFSQNDIGGHTRFVIDISQELEMNGFESTVYVPYFTHFYYQLRVLEGGCKPERLTRYILGQLLRMFSHRFRWRGMKMNPSSKLKVKRFVFKPSKKFLDSFDVIITSASWHVNEIEEAGYRNRNRILHVMHHPHTNEKNKLETYFLDNSIRVVVSSSETHKAATSMGIRSEIIHLGVKIPTGAIQVKKRDTITFFYYNHPRKNPKLIEEIIHELLQRSEASIVVLGNGFPEVPKSFKTRLKVIENVSDEDYFCFLAETKLFVYLSLLEGFGLPPLEAMSVGTATIASAVGAVPEYGDHMHDIVTIEPGTPTNEILKFIEMIYRDGVLREAMQDRGRVKAEKFSTKICAERYSLLIKLIIEKN